MTEERKNISVRLDLWRRVKELARGQKQLVHRVLDELVEEGITRRTKED